MLRLSLRSVWQLSQVSQQLSGGAGKPSQVFMSLELNYLTLLWCPWNKSGKGDSASSGVLRSNNHGNKGFVLLRQDPLFLNGCFVSIFHYSSIPLGVTLSPHSKELYKKWFSTLTVCSLRLLNGTFCEEVKSILCSFKNSISGHGRSDGEFFPWIQLLREAVWGCDTNCNQEQKPRAETS